MLTNFGKRFHFLRSTQNFQNLSLKWDLIKMEIRGFTIKFSKIKAKRRRNVYYKINCNLYYKIKPISYWNKLKRTQRQRALRHHSTLTSTNALKDKRSNPQKHSQVARARIAQYKVFSLNQKTKSLQKNGNKVRDK